MKAPRRFTVEQGQAQPPPDVELMRVEARRLLAEDAEPPTPEELETLTLQLRSHAQVLIPEVVRAAERRGDDIPSYCARACCGEARMKLGIEPLPGFDAGVAYVRRLSRVVNALCDHYENLGGEHT
jgi:hypothetical protein